MNSKLLLLSTSLALALAGTACDRRDTPTDEPTTTPSAANDADIAPAPNPTASMETGPEGRDAASAADDSVALGLLGAVNDHEIQAAQQAQSKQVSAPVLEYAKMMEQQHGDNQVKTKGLGALGSTPEVQNLQEKGKSELAELGTKSGKDYERAYVDAMVKDHTEALALIDGRLLSLASTGPVKDHLAETRGHVAMHLEEAKKLQGK